MNWEERRRMHMIKELLNGKTVDLSKDEDLYYAAFGKNVSLEEFVNRSKFDEAAKVVKDLRNINRDNKGYTDKKNMRMIGGIPSNIFYSRPEFHHSNPDRDKNILKFLRDFPQYRTVDKI